MKNYGRFILVPVGADILTHLSLIYSILDSPKKWCILPEGCEGEASWHMFFLSVKGVISSAVQWVKQGEIEKENIHDKDFFSKYLVFII